MNIKVEIGVDHQTCMNSCPFLGTVNYGDDDVCNIQKDMNGEFKFIYMAFSTCPLKSGPVIVS